MLFAATAISYVDRQVLTVLAPTLRDELGHQQHRLRVDPHRVPARVHVHAAGHGLADRSYRHAPRLRSHHGVVVGGRDPARFRHERRDLRGVPLPARHGRSRQLGGVRQGGLGVVPAPRARPRDRLVELRCGAGLVVSVPIVAWISLTLGWQWAFILTGISGFAWLAVWLWLYRLPQVHPAVTRGVATSPKMRRIDGISARSVSRAASIAQRLGRDRGAHARRPVGLVLLLLDPRVSDAQRRLHRRRRRQVRVDSLPRAGCRHRTRRHALRRAAAARRARGACAPCDHAHRHAADDSGHPRRVRARHRHHLRRHQLGDVRLRLLGAEHDVAVRRCFPAQCGRIGGGTERHGRRRRRHAVHDADRLDARSLRLPAGVHRSGSDSAAGVRGVIRVAGSQERRSWQSSSARASSGYSGTAASPRSRRENPATPARPRR